MLKMSIIIPHGYANDVEADDELIQLVSLEKSNAQSPVGI